MICRIPLDRLELQEDARGKLYQGEIPVRARSTVGTFAMPEANARIRFNFRGCKQVSAEETSRCS